MALKEKFRAKYPHPWLVWEAGAWNVPEVVEGNVAATRLPLTDLRDCLPAGDALCFELVGQTDGSPLRLGRASNNALVVNDATVSREQLHLSPHPGRTLDGDTRGRFPDGDAGRHGPGAGAAHRAPARRAASRG